MKTTVEIADALLNRAKRLAKQRGIPLRQVLESALRTYLEKSDEGKAQPFRLRKCTFAGRGVQAGIREGDWGQIRERIYEGRGG